MVIKIVLNFLIIQTFELFKCYMYNKKNQNVLFNFMQLI
jgi:hypothetical protein